MLRRSQQRLQDLENLGQEDSKLFSAYKCLVSSFRSYADTTGTLLSAGWGFTSIFYGGHHHWGDSFGDAWLMLFEDLGVPVEDERVVKDVRRLALEYAELADREAKEIDKKFALHNLEIPHPAYDEASEYRDEVFGDLHHRFLDDLERIIPANAFLEYHDFLRAINLDI